MVQKKIIVEPAVGLIFAGIGIGGDAIDLTPWADTYVKMTCTRFMCLSSRKWRSF